MLSLEPGTVVIVQEGKKESRWLITGAVFPGHKNAPAVYPAKRWVKSTGKWSIGDYLISARNVLKVVEQS